MNAEDLIVCPDCNHYWFLHAVNERKRSFCTVPFCECEEA